MQWLLTRKVWLLNTRKVYLAHFLKKVDIVRFNSKPSIYNVLYVVISSFISINYLLSVDKSQKKNNQWGCRGGTPSPFEFNKVNVILNTIQQKAIY